MLTLHLAQALSTDKLDDLELFQQKGLNSVKETQIIPLVTKTAGGLEGWLRPWFGEALTITPDFERVAALSEERNALWQRLSQATFLTDPERRALAGFSH